MEKKVKAKSGGIKPALIAVAASAVFWSILAGAGVLNKFEYRIYDALLAVRPIKEENPNLALVEIDDASLDKLGPWPWSRDIIADVLLRLREAGAKAAVFDIEYLSPSKVAVNPDDALLLKEKAGTNEGAQIAAEIFRDNDEFFSKAVQFFGNTWLTINTEQIISINQRSRPQRLDKKRKRRGGKGQRNDARIFAGLARLHTNGKGRRLHKHHR